MYFVDFIKHFKAGQCEIILSILNMRGNNLTVKTKYLRNQATTIVILTSNFKVILCDYFAYDN